jgi:DNA-binding response OmpR family regulator
MDQQLRRSYFGSVPQTILVIDRPQNIERLVRLGILSCAVQVEFCLGKKADALKLIERESPDLLISGLEYLDGNAIEFVNEMNARIGSIPSIFLTEPEQLDLQKQVLRLGAFDIVQRPVDIADLTRRIDRAFRHARGYSKKTRIESFLEYQKLIDESKSRGILVSELVDLKELD